MNDTSWAWLAGLFEGEGCISFVGVNSVLLTIQMTDRDVIERCAKITGAGNVRGPVIRPGVKDQWYWKVGKVDDILAILDEIEPYFGERRSSRCVIAQERLKLVPRKGFCKRGHPKSGDNLYISPKGQRHCKECQHLRYMATKK